MTVSLVAQYQGTLTIPLYITPYKIPDPTNGGYTFNNSGGSDEACIVVAQCAKGPTAVNGGAPAFGLGSGTITLLRPAAAVITTIGQGISDTRFTGNPIVRGVASGGQFGFVEAFNQGAVTTYQAPSDQLLLAGETVQPLGFQMPDITKGIQFTFPSLLNTKQYCGRALFPITAPGFLPISGSQNVGINANGYISSFAQGSGARAFTLTVPGFGTASVKPVDNSGFSGTNFNGNNFISMPNGITYNWNMPAGGTVALMQRLFPTLDIQGGLGMSVDQVGYNVTFSDASLNTRIGTFGFGANTYATCYGMFFNTNGPNQDFYMSADGTKYWDIRYASNNPAIPQLASAANYGGGVYFDKNGLAWMAPSSMSSGGQNQPIWSNGFTFPYGRLSLPQIPPLNIPCWSSCLDRIGGSPGMLQAGIRKLN